MHPHLLSWCVLAYQVFILNRIQHICSPRGRPAVLSPTIRLALRIPSLVLIFRALYGLALVTCMDFTTRSAQWWVRHLRGSVYGRIPEPSELMWSVFLAACVMQCTNVFISSVEHIPPTEEPASFNLGSFAFVLYFYSSASRQDIGANGSFLVALQLIELALLAIATTRRPPYIPRLAISTAVGVVRLLHFIACPLADYPTVFQGHRFCEVLVLIIIVGTIALHSIAMLLTEGHIHVKSLLSAPTPVIRSSDDFSLACIKLCTICLHATNLASISTEIALPTLPRRTFVELNPSCAQVRWGLEESKPPGLDNEVRTVCVKHERERNDANGILRGIDKVRAGWEMAGALTNTATALAARPLMAAANSAYIPPRIRGIPRMLRLVWHGTNGEKAREMRLVHERVEQERALRDMDMNGVALLADAGGNEFRDIVQRHHARAEGAPLTRSEYAALARTSSAVNDTAELLGALRERRRLPPLDNANARLCVVCCAEERDVICWPCRCIALCDGCREALVHLRSSSGAHLCPTCRTPIEAYSKLYLP